MEKKMRKLLLALGFIASTVSAQSDLAATLTISDLSLSADISIDRLALDVDFGDRYLAVNGEMVFATGFAPVTGTCINSADGGLFCNLQVDAFSFNLVLDSAGIGTISFRDTSGNTVDAGTIALEP
jgi:hypothetical protein